MIFHSIEFLIFLTCFVTLYWCLSERGQSWLLLIGSYIFYGWIHPWFVTLLIASTFMDFYLGQAIARSKDRRKLMLIISLGFNLALLGTFKYASFFADNFSALLSIAGLSWSPPTLSIFLPAGISFYTFQSIGYIIDVYRGSREPCKSLLHYANYIAFFPQLVAGPIERSTALLPQLTQKRQLTLEQVRSGLVLIGWGFIQKLVIADNVALIANEAFSIHYPSFWLVWSGVFAFCIQIYADFSAYSDIARGSAKLLGVELMVNFNNPYIARSPADFWRRWHISLNQWFKDYLFIPLLGPSRAGPLRLYLCFMIVFGISGLWHGASWNFVLWGAYHGTLMVIFHLFSKIVPARISQASALVPLRVAFMFALTNIGWLLFREHKLSQLVMYLTLSPFAETDVPASLPRYFFLSVFIYSLPLWIETWLEHVVPQRETAREIWKRFGTPLSIGFVLASAAFILVAASPNPSDFIYFQF
jgi:D-alanyl-lipoteichoic acid acyltransferase DltB (MBOAT superfamily)